MLNCKQKGGGGRKGEYKYKTIEQNNKTCAKSLPGKKSQRWRVGAGALELELYSWRARALGLEVESWS